MLANMGVCEIPKCAYYHYKSSKPSKEYQKSHHNGKDQNNENEQMIIEKNNQDKINDELKIEFHIDNYDKHKKKI